MNVVQAQAQQAQAAFQALQAQHAANMQMQAQAQASSQQQQAHRGQRRQSGRRSGNGYQQSAPMVTYQLYSVIPSLSKYFSNMNLSS
jgi:hypothetical protein